MAVQVRVTSKERANKVFKPSPKETDKSKLSNFFPKDSIFNKTKSYRMKGREQVQTLEADWRNIALNGYKIVLIKDNAVSKADLKHFPKEAKAYYLDEKKTTKAPAKAKAPAKVEEPVKVEEVEKQDTGSEKVD